MSTSDDFEDIERIFKGDCTSTTTKQRRHAVRFTKLTSEKANIAWATECKRIAFMNRHDRAVPSLPRVKWLDRSDPT